MMKSGDCVIRHPGQYTTGLAMVVSILPLLLSVDGGVVLCIGQQTMLDLLKVEKGLKPKMMKYKKKKQTLSFFSCRVNCHSYQCLRLINFILHFRFL